MDRSVFRRTLAKNALAFLAALLLFAAGFPPLTQSSHAGGRGAAAAVEGNPVEKSLGIRMVKAPAGRYRMGSPSIESHRDDDELQHWVAISRPFLIGATEVTQGQWRKVMGRNPSFFYKNGDDFPLESVTWYDAVRFSNKLSDLAGLDRCYVRNGDKVRWKKNCDGYRLPTEAEWEYAARAGKPTPFVTGRCLTTDQANYNGKTWKGCPQGRNRAETTRVGAFPPNRWGLHDMHGNVWEWVWDNYAPYSSASVVDPTGPEKGEQRVIRGGSCLNNARICRSALRGSLAPNLGYNGILGLRIARSLPE